MKNKNNIKTGIVITLFSLAFISGLKAQTAESSNDRQPGMGVKFDSAGNSHWVIYGVQAQPTQTNNTSAVPAKHLDTAWANPKAHYEMVHRNKSRILAMKADSANKAKKTENEQPAPTNESGKQK